MFSCKRNFEAPVPDTSWDLFESAPAEPLPAGVMKKMEGVYTVLEGNEAFGPLAVLKWSYTVIGTDTLYHLSVFTEKDVAFFVLEARRRNDSILLNGWWRRMANTATGTARFTIAPANGADFLFSSDPNPPVNGIVINGVYGTGAVPPNQPLNFSYNRPHYNALPFEVIAHRGGGRNADLLPASENSVEMLLLAARLGATGVEIDVRMTSDGVPVLYHDATLNERLVQKNGITGPIKNFTFQQLQATVRLKRGGKIPTLREGLQTILQCTPLRYVWLDVKYDGPLDKVRELQQEFMNLAAAQGRPLEISIGIPDEDVFENFKLLPDYQNIPSLSELDTEKTQSINAKIWAPMFTKGLQNDDVLAMQSQGRRAFVWTVDGPNNVRKFMYEGRFNGILSNQPTIVAYYYYARL